MKNPLSTINVNLQLLAEDIERVDDGEHQRWLRRLNRVRQEADRVRNTLDDFLRFAGKFELQPLEVDLRNLVDDLVDFFAPQAEAAGVVLRTSLPTGPVPVRVDADLIKQALLNLMINAVQAMATGGELIVRVWAESGTGRIEVTDTGPGIDAETLDKIFTVYFSTKKGGSGLGLPTSRRIVREHGGRLRVESEPGKGTRFTIELPLPGSDTDPRRGRRV